jgi:hypothetical protein
MIDTEKMRFMATRLRAMDLTTCTEAADAIDTLLAALEVSKQEVETLMATVAECRDKAFVEGYADSLLGAAVGSPDEVPAFVGQTVTELRAAIEDAAADNARLRECALKYLTYLDVADAVSGLERDLRDPNMVGSALSQRQEEGS